MRSGAKILLRLIAVLAAVVGLIVAAALFSILIYAVFVGGDAASGPGASSESLFCSLSSAVVIIWPWVWSMISYTVLTLFVLGIALASGQHLSDRAAYASASFIMFALLAVAVVFAREGYYQVVKGGVPFGADAVSFTLVTPTAPFLSNVYAHDNNHVYYRKAGRWRVILQGDPDTIAPLGAASSSIDYLDYAVDSEHVYYDGVSISNQPRAFKLLGTSGYSEDETHVFFGGAELNEADPQSFELATSSMFYMCGEITCFEDAKDQNHLYSQGAEITNALQ